MDESSRHFLLGIGMLGAVLGAALGVVAGDMHRDCADVYVVARTEGAAYAAAGVHGLCDALAQARVAGIGLVLLSGLVAAVPTASKIMARGRSAPDT